ncbi:AlpA family transcriptional regulator [Paucibacter sp. O1-1]|nr:AlpA family transcriptional regulator [Paucibacter sp. O1-1]MDA3830163.1 AlpA family transcriptional regulator [Paucibacter sp. O1-1]
MPNGQADARMDRMPPPLLRLPSVMRMTGLGRSTIYRMITKRQFPSPVRLGIRAVAWRHSDLSNWIDERTPAP